MPNVECTPLSVWIPFGLALASCVLAAISWGYTLKLRTVVKELTILRGRLIEELYRE